MTKTDVIVGALWGDEGKGKYVGWVGHRYDLVMRVNASTNAGHCVSDGEHTYVTRQLPSVFHPRSTTLCIAPGALLNLVALERELHGRPDVDDLRGKLKVASSVSLVIRPYVEKGQGGLSKLLGSTHQGTGPSAVARTARHSLRLYDVEHALRDGERAQQTVLEKIERTCRETSPLRFSDTDAHRTYYREVLDELMTAYERIYESVGGFCIDFTRFMSRGVHSEGGEILLEGCNGLLLDNLHGALPHVTSASTNISAMLCGANLSPRSVRELIVVMASYSTCLGKRPFPTEMSQDASSHFFENCNEVDVAEHNRRRLGWLDLPALRKALSGAQGAVLHMNKLDVLSGLAEIKVCTHYTVDGATFDIMPDDPWFLARAEPRYESVAGWPEPIRGVRAFSELPLNAQHYVQLVADALPNEIVSLGVGPMNEEVIVLQ